MGCATYASCRTCKKFYYLGYGSYGWDGKRRALFPAAVHEGHDTVQWIDDSEWGLKDGTLYAIGPYGVQGEPILEGINGYELLYLDVQGLGMWQMIT